MFNICTDPYAYMCIPTPRSRAMRDPARASADALGRRSRLGVRLAARPGPSHAHGKRHGDHGKWRGLWPLSLTRQQRVDDVDECGERLAPIRLLGAVFVASRSAFRCSASSAFDALALGQPTSAACRSLVSLTTLSRRGGWAWCEARAQASRAGTPWSPGAWPSLAPSPAKG